jgi:hypothetical protein
MALLSAVRAPFLDLAGPDGDSIVRVSERAVRPARLGKAAAA